MKLIIVILLATFVAVEAAHLNYHHQSERSELQNEVNGRSTVEF
jgi:hypothetical protein